MSLEGTQKDVDEWTKQFDPQYWQPLEQFAQLGEETGEVGRSLNRIHGPRKAKKDEEIKNLGQELVDVLFVLCCIANREDINLQKEWNEMTQKRLYKRDNQRFKRKEESQ